MVAACALATVSVGCGSRPPGDQAKAKALENREAAYRANNRGVVLLEQFAFDKAADAFSEALTLDPALRLARINLPIALFYANKADDARKAAEAARSAYQDAPQPVYILGLIARADNRLDDAADAFTRVREADANDAGAAVNLAQVRLSQGKNGEAVSISRDALALEPFNATAQYTLGRALTQSGNTADGAKALETFNVLRASPYAITYSQAYLEQGRYAQAVASTGLEADLMTEEPPAVVFHDATSTWLTGDVAPRASPTDTSGPGAITMADLDGDGDLDVINAGPGVRVFRNDRRRFADVTVNVKLSAMTSGVAGVVAGDLNNDGRPDLVVITTSGPRIFLGAADGTFSGGALAAQIPGVRTAALADVDHDGDLDLLYGGALLRNANATFTDITQSSGITGLTDLAAVTATDFDNRRDIDLLTVSSTAAPRLFRNLRDGTFTDVAQSIGLPPGPFTTLAMGDMNKDGFSDFFFGRASSPGQWALSDGRGKYRIEDAPPESRAATAAQIFDYDNDGLVDLLVVTADGPRMFRNVGAGFKDQTERAVGAELRSMKSVTAITAGDVDLDGNTDVIARFADGTLHVWRNDTPAASRHPSIHVKLTTRVSNRSAAGAVIEMRAGSLYQKFETAMSSPSSVPADIVFGVGQRRTTDVVRVLWPSGILQAETPPSPTPDPFVITELDRKPSSCPYLFTWNGQRFEFVTDFMGGGEMGYWEGPGKRNTPDPDEYVRIRGNQLQPKDGRFDIRVTNELEETLFADRFQLLSITHPRHINVFPNEGMTDPPKPFRLYAVTDERAPVRAIDDHGHDVADRLARIDRRYPDDFTLGTFRGYAAPHALALDLGPVTKPTVLLMTAWTDYAFSSDNLAASQAGLSLTTPALEIKDANGNWRLALADIGIPVGRPQTIVVDLETLLRPGEREVRILTNMRIYWDQVLVASSVPADGVRIVKLDPAVATLHDRGFSAEVRPDGQEPPVPDYSKTLTSSPWKVMPGRYTREGDVGALLTRVDDRFVIAKPGDELVLSFDATAAGPLPEGWTRTFLLLGDGFSKEMDINSASPDFVEPLPFHRMTKYPYGASEHYPDTDETRRYRELFNTRIITRPYLPLR